MKRSRPVASAFLVCAALAATAGARARGEGAPASSAEGEWPVEEVRLENGMRLLLARRAGSPMTAAAWVVHSGSGDEIPGSTGVAHLIEHLMFKGSRVIGSRDPKRESEWLDRRDVLEQEWRATTHGSGRRAELEREIASVDERLRGLHVKGEFALVYTEAGAVGMNALTREDLTLYFAMVPAPRLELWFWMESDRLLAPAFRELYDEYPVIEQEREQRIGAVPSGAEHEAFRRQFWGERHPYSWPAAGMAGDLRNLDRPVARAWFDAHYHPSRMTAVLVGDFDPAQVKQWARRYFGRLPESGPVAESGSSPPPAEPVRFSGSCECRPTVELRFHTVPFGSPDAAALDVVAGLLAGRTGRLHRSLVLEQGVAFSASALHAPLRRAGSFSVEAQAREGVDLDVLESSMRAELERLGSVPVPELELQKVKNQITTEASRQIKEPLAYGLRLLVYDALEDWRHLYRWPGLAQAVTAQDVQRVASRYLSSEDASVLVLRRTDTREVPP